MEVYTLDALFRRDQVIDRFKSLVWAERFGETGDFQLDIYSSFQARSLFTPGTHLAMNESYRVMVVETTSDDTDKDGNLILTVKGRSLEMILMDRVAKESLSDLTTSPKWTITDDPAAVARKVFHDICVTGILDVGDIIPFINEGTFLPDSNIPEPVDPITVEITPASVYDVIKQLCDVWGMGFHIIRHPVTSQLYFDIYTGSDRTTAQTTLPAVVFAPELDNLQNTSELTTITDAKNVAYVFSPAGFQKVYAAGVDPEVEGFERKVLVVNADDITTETADVEAALLQRGAEELANHRTIQAFDGEISQNSQYKYQTDYWLGDIVEQRNTDGVTNNMRVTEQIFVSDDQGERKYPTLTLNTYINTGSWLSWLNNRTWADMEDEEVYIHWADQP